ncbi:MAG TPA: translation initiation factor IF-5A [Candidatus Omnitrophota bacterium]|nr:translation initiation factor IF-5A [Candidatus Omnitrophota bacterium]
MVLKIISATEAKPGTNIILEGEPYTVRSVDVSKTGKHGAHKCRFEAVGMLADKKKVFVMPGTDRLEVPLVEKRKGQVLSISGDTVSIMDLENFETIELPLPEELKPELEINSNVEYWDIEGVKVLKRKV